MAFLERDGARLYYEVHGEAGDRPPLVLTHGFSASGRMWEPNVEALCADRQVLVWDLRGHARTDAPAGAPYSEEAAVADMAALLDVVGWDCAVIGGMSLGGYLSLAFATRHPERVAALLLVDTGPGFRRDEPREEWNTRALATADRLEREGLAALADSPEVAGAGHADVDGVARAARGLLVQRDARVIESLASIAVPTLVVVGAEDHRFLAAADYMATRIPGARKVVLDGAGHAANVDRPDEFNASVREFLDSVA